jgi:predicted AlkP superfamily phosphohydrolase/phosphomutase
MISGFPAPTNRLSAFPEHIQNELRNKFPKYRIEIDFIDENYNKLNKEEFILDVYNILENRCNLSFYLLNNYKWDLFFVVFTMSDRIQHVFWPYIDKSYKKHIKDKEKYKNVLFEFYIKIDKIIGKFLKSVNEETITYVISDHGFESITKKFGMQNWLIKNNLTKKKSKSIINRYKLFKLLYMKFAKIENIDLNALFQKLPKILKNLLVTQDMCYPGTGGIKLNKHFGKKINAKKFEIKLKNNLYKYKDLETSEPVIDHVFKKEELYHGKFLKNSLDFIILPKKGYSVSRWNKNNILEKTPSITANHFSLDVQKGILFINGKHVLNKKISMNCYDLVPTILGHYDIHIKNQFDGKNITSRIQKKPH